MSQILHGAYPKKKNVVVYLNLTWQVLVYLATLHLKYHLKSDRLA